MVTLDAQQLEQWVTHDTPLIIKHTHGEYRNIRLLKFNPHAIFITAMDVTDDPVGMLQRVKILSINPEKRALIIWLNNNNRRYYTAHMQRDLFSNWVLFLTWGRQATRLGGSKTVAFASKVDAETYVDKLNKLRIKRGYQVI